MNVSVMSLSMVREGGGVEVEVDCEEETLAAEFHATIVEKQDAGLRRRGYYQNREDMATE